ncbi:MAG: hypothetical protein KC731_09800 [Myxococcales bacterium]|nr:hypothetical protein [Myxococcales bacterium]
MKRLVISALLLLSIVGPPPTSTFAQEDASHAADAVRIGNEALDHFANQRFAEAYVAFAQAEGLAHSPVFVSYMARCKRELGELLEARRLLQGLVAETLPAGSPEPWVRAQRDARNELTAVEADLPRLAITVERWASGDRLMLDGEAVATSDLGKVTLPVDPGAHRVVVLRAEQEVAGQDVSLEPGAAQAVTLVAPAQAPLIAPPPPPAPTTTASPPLPPPSPEETGDAGDGNFLPGALVVGLGASGLLVGAITGGLALAAASKAEEGCTPGSDGVDICPLENQEHDETASRLATVSTVSFIVGGVAAATGVVLLITLGGSEDEVALSVGPGRLGLVGRF